ncbi:hypothetical protein TNCV_2693261 [Trichonephila clavipes]|uniref:Uncharacterized protein n=1 Tax=Trichonephila clavipes TaxID=2585209 RepID=A0A8X6VZ62_TRICX|nr:hypothetical protein TNCV_2693261 [Trichonephila clavipes]
MHLSDVRNINDRHSFCTTPNASDCRLRPVLESNFRKAITVTVFLCCNGEVQTASVGEEQIMAHVFVSDSALLINLLVFLPFKATARAIGARKPGDQRRDSIRALSWLTTPLRCIQLKVTELNYNINMRGLLRCAYATHNKIFSRIERYSRFNDQSITRRQRMRSMSYL